MCIYSHAPTLLCAVGANKASEGKEVTTEAASDDTGGKGAPASKDTNER